MSVLYHHSYVGKGLQRKPGFQRKLAIKVTVLFLCLSILAGVYPMPAFAADTGEKLSDIVTFDAITLHYTDSHGQMEEAAIQDNALIEKGSQVVLYYSFGITEEQCGKIEAGTEYNLEVSPHLVLPDLTEGSPLTVEREDGSKEQFGTIYADGQKAWVTFKTKPLPGPSSIPPLRWYCCYHPFSLRFGCSFSFV